MVSKRDRQAANSGDSRQPVVPVGSAPGEKSTRDVERRLAEKGLLHPSVTFVMCGDESKSKCASAKEMRAAWKALKQGIKSRRKESGIEAAAVRARCLGICLHGPLIGVQPQGCWYADCDPSTVEDILHQHLDTERPPPDR